MGLLPYTGLPKLTPTPTLACALAVIKKPAQITNNINFFMGKRLKV
jgi:hypothetical protein